MSDNTRATLLQRLRDGADQLCWDEFFRCYWPLIYAFARHRGCSEHTAEEVVQEVMLTVFKQRDFYQYDPQRGRFRDWLRTLVRNKVAEYRRRPSARIHAPGGQDSAGPPEPEGRELAPDVTWEDAFEDALVMVLLDVVRREINPRAYLAFELFALEGLPGDQVARITGMSRNAVYKSQRRVFRRLEELGSSYRDDGQLHQRVQRAMRSRPDAIVERSLTARVQRNMQSR